MFIDVRERPYITRRSVRGGRLSVIDLYRSYSYQDLLHNSNLTSLKTHYIISSKYWNNSWKMSRPAGGGWLGEGRGEGANFCFERNSFTN